MRLHLSPFDGWMRSGFRESAAATELVMVGATGRVDRDSPGIRPLGAGDSAAPQDVTCADQSRALKQDPASVDEASAGMTGSTMETQLERVADIPAVEDVKAPPPRRTMRERLRRPLLLAVPIALAVFGIAGYLAEEPYVSTNDAFVRAAKVTLNARVSGQAVEVAVRDNERVRQGQVLFRIDPEPYQIAVDQAEARLLSARLQIDGLKATYRQQQAELQSAKDSGAFDEREYERKKALICAVRRAAVSQAPA